MGLFSSAKKKTPGYDDTAGRGTAQPPCQLYPPPHQYGAAPAHPQAGYAAPVPARLGGDGGTASPEHALPPPYPPPNYCAPPNIVVNQFYIAAAALPGMPQVAVPPKSAAVASTLRLGSVVNLATDLLPMDVPHFFDDRPVPCWHDEPGTSLVNQGAALYDQLSSKFDRVLTAIDRDHYEGNEGELFTYGPPPPPPHGPHATGFSPPEKKPDYPKGQTSGVMASLLSGHCFAKVDLYANARLPLNLPPMKL